MRAILFPFFFNVEYNPGILKRFYGGFYVPRWRSGAFVFGGIINVNLNLKPKYIYKKYIYVLFRCNVLQHEILGLS